MPLIKKDRKIFHFLKNNNNNDIANIFLFIMKMLSKTIYFAKKVLYKLKCSASDFLKIIHSIYF